MLECRTVRHLVSPVSEWKNWRCQNQSSTRLGQCNAVWHFYGLVPDKIIDAEMPMPAFFDADERMCGYKLRQWRAEWSSAVSISGCAGHIQAAVPHTAGVGGGDGGGGQYQLEETGLSSGFSLSVNLSQSPIRQKSQLSNHLYCFFSTARYIPRYPEVYCTVHCKSVYQQTWVRNVRVFPLMNVLLHWNSEHSTV
jgi:hypothetical protein